jgi:hypothetical protein
MVRRLLLSPASFARTIAAVHREVAVPTLDAGCLGRLIHRTGAGTEAVNVMNGAAKVIQLEGSDVIGAPSGSDKP